MADAVLQLDQASSDKFTEMISRVQREMKKALPDAVRIAAAKLAISLGASTKSSGKKRKLRSNKGDDHRFTTEDYPKFVHVYRRDGTRRRAYILEGHEKDSPWRTIRKPALAKSSWKWMVGELGRAVSAPQPKIPGVTTVARSGTDFDPVFTLTNKLGYIETAVRLGREPINTVMDRASRALEQRIASSLGRSIRR